MELSPLLIDDIVRQALREDIGHGDITTAAVVPREARVTAHVVPREPGVMCGHLVAETVFRLLDAAVTYERLVPEGQAAAAGQAVARIAGPARPVLTGERVALNFLQRMGGIATMARDLAAALVGTGARLVETRKTVPGLRLLDKYAVWVGGGATHRFHLSDAILIKDNHIALAGGVGPAVRAAREYLAPFTARVEVEVEDLDGVREALAAGADIIMLDNMSPVMMQEAVAMVGGRALVEASGDITPENIATVARTGVDFISVGALTHSVRAWNLGLDVDNAL